MRHLKTILFPLLLCAFAQGQESLPVRQVAAPPSDFLSGRLRLPAPEQSATQSSSAWLAVSLERDTNGRWSWEGEFSVSARGALQVAAIGSDALQWQVSLAPSSAAPRGLESWGRQGAVLLNHDDPLGLDVQGVELGALRAGTWRVRIESDGPGRGWWAARDRGPVRLESWVATWSTRVDTDVPVLARLRVAGVTSPADRTARIDRAELVVPFAGHELREPMHDDGHHGDGEAGDGLFGAFVPGGVGGRLQAWVEARGTTSDGQSFLRTTHHRLYMVAPVLRLKGHTVASVMDAHRSRIALRAQGLEAFSPTRRLLLSAELWGRDASGSALPVVWLSRLLEAERVDGASSARELELSLAVDTRWIDLAQAQPPFELRAVRVQDAHHHVVLASLEHVGLADLPLPRVEGESVSQPTFEMLAAPWSSAVGLGTSNSYGEVPTRRALLLSHGHCSGGNVWPLADFSPPRRVFSDPNSDRTNDQFAQLMLAQTQDLYSFGVVAHSQGGLAALQLYTFYVSGLDRAVGARRIQSVASPYQGTPLASFSAGCGTDNDLTPSEAAAWLANIPSWARAEVWFRTVSAGGQACNVLTDFLLADPEDGVVEMARGDLPGGNSVGDTPGWCHTTGMNWPACYLDHARNQAMDTLAAR